MPWVLPLAYSGYLLGENRGEVESFSHYLDYTGATAILVVRVVYPFMQERA